MRTKVIAGNWKMNKTVGEALEFFKALDLELKQYDRKLPCEVVVAPTYTALSKSVEFLRGTQVKIGAQNLHWEESGAFTGEISAAMLKDVGVECVIIGHSERRQFFGETDTNINKKIVAALQHGLTPIFCIGETLEQREANQVESIVSSQLAGGLAGLDAANMLKIIIAYEPVWAIGTGKTATKEQAEEVHSMIRKMLAKRFDQACADAIKILYGGSVKPSNSKELLSQPNIDGALIGGASLNSSDFAQIIQSIA